MSFLKMERFSITVCAIRSPEPAKRPERQKKAEFNVKIQKKVTFENRRILEFTIKNNIFTINGKSN